MKGKEKNNNVVFSSIQGGIVKTSIMYLLVNSLAARGKRILLIDIDHNNSLSYKFVNPNNSFSSK